MDRHHDGAELLLSARRDPTQRLNEFPEAIRPRTEEQAYLVQRAVMAQLGEIGGWKVGAAGPDGFTCAPLPAKFILPSGVEVGCRDRAVEAEIAVCLGRDLPPQEAPYAASDVLEAIESAHPAIEVLESRFTDMNRMDPLSLLSDLLSHHSLVLGPPIQDWQRIDLAGEGVRVLANGAEINTGKGNPAGDMMRLLVWLANTGARWAGGLRRRQVVTTGSWTGKDFVPEGADVRIRFDRCGEAAVRFRA